MYVHFYKTWLFEELGEKRDFWLEVNEQSE